MKYILEVVKLTKNFTPCLSFAKLFGFGLTQRRPNRALEDVSFSLEGGKVLCILGPNGAGKTTLLKIISTLILPDKGSVKVGGYRLGDDDEKIKSYLGLILDEERSFYWRLSGRQNLEFFAALYGMDKKTARARINHFLKLFSIDYADERFNAYSTGMKKNFALIRALLPEPKLLLFDEPTKSLDYASGFNLRNFIKETLVKKEKKTVVFTTHHLDEALEFADLFMILHKGKLCAMGTLDELKKRANAPTASLSEIFLKLTHSATSPNA